MVKLGFAVEGVAIEPYAAAPLLLFRLRISTSAPVENVLLQCQLRIDATRRRYSPPEQESLGELFGDPSRWRETLHSMLWTHASIQVPAFEYDRLVDLPVPCSFDFNVAGTKYFHGLQGGEVPLALLFSGTVFYRDEGGFLQMDQIPWSSETAYRLPVALWREMIEIYYPASAWLRIERSVFDALHRYKRQRGFTSFDEALRAVLQQCEEPAS